MFIGLVSPGCKPATKVDSESAGDSTATSSPSTFTEWQVGMHPESVTIHGARVYVTQFGPALEPLTQDGDGYVAVYDANGGLIDTLIAGLDAPKGSEVIGNVLFVADVDTLFGINTATGKITYAAPLPGRPMFLNGLAATAAGQLYVSATDAGKIWLVDPAQGTTKEIATLPGVNGLAVDAATNALYAVVYPQSEQQTPGAYLIDVATGQISRIGTYAGVLDGVAVSNNTLYTTDWNPGGAGGRMVAIDLSTGAARTVAESARFTGPADFALLGDGIALVPMLKEDRVVVVRLK